ARRDEAAARFTALQAGIIGAFNESRSAFGAAKRKLAAADELLNDERAQFATAQKQFEAGEIDRLALRSSELEVAAAELARAEAAIELQQAIGAVEDALQRPLAGALPSLEVSP